MNDAITVLFIHWNKIWAKGAIAILKALEKNQVVQVLDLSFNAIGADKTNSAATQFAITCQENSGLVHLDISHCNFTLVDIEIIGKNILIKILQYLGEGLKKNHTILGIHLIGNKGKINSKGKGWMLFCL